MWEKVIGWNFSRRNLDKKGIQTNFLLLIVSKAYMNILTRLFVLVTKNGSIFEMTTKLGGKMLQMLFVVIQNFFWWNYFLSTKRFSWWRGNLKQRILSNLWLYKENYPDWQTLEYFCQKSFWIHSWSCTGLPNIRVVGLNSEWWKKCFHFKEEGS